MEITLTNGEKRQCTESFVGSTPRATVHDGERDRPSARRHWALGTDGRIYIMRPGVGWREVRADEIRLNPPPELVEARAALARAEGNSQDTERR